MNNVQPQLCIACSIFGKEIGALQASGQLELPVILLSSRFHMNPAELESHLREALETARAQDPDRAVVLAYGDCCSHMNILESGSGTARTEGLNCCEILLGRDVYRRLRKEGAFFLMPEWALSWKDIFLGELGLLGPNAKSLMREMHSRLIYLDTGLVPVPQEALREASAFLGLRVEIMTVSLEPLLASLRQAARSACSHE